MNMYIIHKNIIFVFLYYIKFLGTLVGKNLKIIKFKIFWYFFKSHKCVGKMSNIMMRMCIRNYLILHIFGKIQNIFKNGTEWEHHNVGKFWGKNKWKLLHTETFKSLLWAVSNMGNARKKYVNIKSLSSGDIFALLDSNESDDEGDIENIMNNSDAEFAAEDESVISTNIIRKEEIGD